jgi:hypothetical protein
VAATGAVAGQSSGGAADLLFDADDFHPQMAAERIEQLRQELAELFDSRVLGRIGFNASHSFVTRLEKILHVKVANIARDYGLTEGQQQKLLLAGRGDIKRLLDRIFDARRQFLEEGAGLDRPAHNRRLSSITEPFRETEMIGPFRDGSLFLKIASRDLTVAQISNLKAKDEIARYYGRISTVTKDSTEFHDVDFTNSAAMDDDGLASAIRLPNLRLLKLESTGITDAGLAHLQGQDSLEVLDVSRSQINGPGFIHLQGLKALQVVIARGARFGDNGLANLKVLTNLSELHLQGTQITDAGLMALNLSNFVNLKEIGLSRTRVTDRGLAHLRSCPSLERLHLIRTQITDAGLANLNGMKNLRQLLLDQTQITDAGLAALDIPRTD